MNAKCFAGKRKRLGAAGCYPHWRNAAMLAAAFAVVTLGVARLASAHEDPPGCTVNGAVARITEFPSTAQHGQEICYRVEIDNRSGFKGTNCNVTGLNTRLVLPDGSTVTITNNATVNENELFGCPGSDTRCITLSDCTIPGRTGYRYIVNHAHEHGATGTNCPPSPAGGKGEVSAFIESTGGTVHLETDVGASLCKAIAATVPHGACCEPCTGTCNDAGTVNECPAPSTFTPGALCSPGTCTPLVCNDGKSCTNPDHCDPTTGLCVFPPVNAKCNDGFSCTNPDLCDPTNPASNPTTGCLITPVNDKCNDGFSCTNPDVCDPTNPAHNAAGCVITPVNTKCNDGFSCTNPDVCDPANPAHN